MPTTAKALFRGAATTTLTTTLFTAAFKTVVTDIVVTNTAGSAGTFTLSLDGVRIAENVTVAANDSTTIQIKQVIEEGDTITGGASATTINFHISGVELS